MMLETISPAAAKHRAVMLRIEAQKVMRNGVAESPDQLARYRELCAQAEALETAARCGRGDGAPAKPAPAKPPAEQAPAKPVVRRFSVADAVRLADDGASFADLAALLGCNEKTVAGKVQAHRAATPMIAKPAGAKPMGAMTGAPPPGRGERVKKIDMAMLRHMADAGETRRRMAAELQVTVDSVARALRRLRAG